MTSTSNNPLSNPLFVKGVSAFALSIAIDKYYFQNDDMKSNAMYAAATTAGILLGSKLGEQIPAIIGDSAGLYTGKLVSQRVVEIATGGIAAYAINSYAFKNEYNRDLYMQKLLAIVAIDVAAEYLTDYVLGTSLGYLTA